MATGLRSRRPVSRRTFLGGAGALLAGLVAGACQADRPEEAAQAASPITSSSQPTASPSSQPTAPSTPEPTIPPTRRPTEPPTPQPTVPPASPTSVEAAATMPTSAVGPEPLARVAIAQTRSYEAGQVRDRMRELLESQPKRGLLETDGD